MCGCGCGGEEKKKAPQVGKMDPAKKNSPIVDESAQMEGAECVKGARKLCWFNGKQYTPGAAICSGRILMKCNTTGGWSYIGRC